MTVDVFERRSAVPEHLAAAGVTLESARLPIGDYRLGPGLLVERKTVSDLHESLRVGRLWPQLGRLRAAAATPVLVVEGASLGGRIGDRAARASLLAIHDLGVVVIRSRDSDDSAQWLIALATRAVTKPVVRVRRPYARPYARLEVSEAMLAVVPGISPTIARRLLERFGSLEQVLTASETELTTIRGVGVRRSAAIRAAAVAPRSRSERGPAAHPPSKRASGRNDHRLLGPGRTAAPESGSLALLPPGPDAVRMLSVRGT